MNRTNNVRYYSFGHQSKENPPCYQTMQTISEFIPKNYFLGLESQYFLEIDCTEKKIEDLNIAINIEEEEHKK